MLNYFYFDDVDFNAIESNSYQLLNSQTNNKLLPLEVTDRYDILWNDVLRYITSNKSILLEGFIRFRILDYIKILDSFVDFAGKSIYSKQRIL